MLIIQRPGCLISIFSLSITLSLSYFPSFVLSRWPLLLRYGCITLKWAEVPLSCPPCLFITHDKRSRLISNLFFHSSTLLCLSLSRLIISYPCLIHFLFFFKWCGASKMNCLFRQWTLIIHRAANAAGEWKLNKGFSQSMSKRSQSCGARLECVSVRVGVFVCEWVQCRMVGKWTGTYTVYNILSL